MGIFSKLFAQKTLTINDPELGVLTSNKQGGNKITWQTKTNFLGFEIDVSIPENKKGLNITPKEIILSALNNEILIKSEAEKALRKQYENAVMDFTSLKELFDVIEISSDNDGFILTCQEKNGQLVFFNIHFKNNRQVSVFTEDY